jgi:protein-S-isoprenylcysteine O-methyltransferase Ste14
MNPWIRKILYIIFWYLLYPQLWYFLFLPQLLYASSYRIQFFAIILSYIFGIMDTFLRPFSESMRRDLETNPKYTWMLLILFLLNPPLLILAFSEGHHIIASYMPIWASLEVSLFGILIEGLGGALTLMGRNQLSRFGSGFLQIEGEHKLIKSGIYRIIRHPIYAGGLISIIGLYLSFHSIVVTLMVSGIYFIVFRQRLLFEEEMLLQEFGEEYKRYMRKTWRLIPYIY